MPSDEFKAHMKSPCAHLKEIGWEQYYGTTNSGNAPEFKATSNPCGVDFGSLNPQLVYDLDIRESDFRFIHIKCHYSTESNINQIVNKNNFSPNYGEWEDVSSTASHTVTSGIMIRFNRGSKYGWLCVDDACPYYQDTGQRYFYI